jgi:predicted permease
VHPNCSYAPGSGFIFLFLSALAGCTEPVALFTTGVFLSSKSPFAIGLLRSIAYMIAKCVLVPAVMVGCAKAVGLEDAPARASVILASLPITGVAFTLADRYDVGQNETLSNILFGNVLVLPTTLSWVYFMDAVNLFETASFTASTSSTCS